MSRLSHRPSKPAYYIVDWRILPQSSLCKLHTHISSKYKGELKTLGKNMSEIELEQEKITKANIWDVFFLFYLARYSVNESHYLEVAQWAIFMEQNMSSGLILVCWQYWKKKLGRLWATFEADFFMFSWSKKKKLKTL